MHCVQRIGQPSALPPRRGTDKPAQGNALGIETNRLWAALKGRNNIEAPFCFALSGL